MKLKPVLSFLNFLQQAVFTSYAMLFFSKNKLLAVFVLLVSFFNPFAGSAGLAALLIAIIAAYNLGYTREQISTGYYIYSALLLGLGMGTFYETGLAFWILLALASLLSVLISLVLVARFQKNNLPALSLAFILSFWVIILAAKQFAAVGLTERNIYWVNTMYSLGGNQLIGLVQKIEGLQMPDVVAGFFHSMSAILFQSNIAAGIVLSIGLLLYSRIGFTLMVMGYAAAIGMHHVMSGFSNTGTNYYNLGTNFMLVSVAIGGIYLIPSPRSYLWALICVPVSYLLVEALGKITYTWGLPVFSLPFCITVILFLHCLRLRSRPGKLVITHIQYFNSEINLYRFINNRERVLNSYYYHLSLPFMGEWMVSQGYDGNITHIGEWSKALDFVILDEEMKTYQSPGAQLSNFYCYNKPVLAPADGSVEEIVDHVEDNEPGENNTQQNWGNTIVIKHAVGLYTKLSHLKKNSFKVQKGSYVRRGDIVALCGNSGRSPEPHLHFQVQATPYIGSKTTAYPVAYFLSKQNKTQSLQTFSTPKEGSFISNITPNTQLQQAFNFQPGCSLRVEAPGFETEEWEAFTTIYNESYLYCSKHKSYAYFNNNGTLFYFTSYSGRKNTLLYYFFLSAYKIALTTEKQIVATDHLSQNHISIHWFKWLQDFVAPFYIFMKLKYQSQLTRSGDALGSGAIVLSSNINEHFFGMETKKLQSTIEIKNGQVAGFSIKKASKTIEAICTA